MTEKDELDELNSLFSKQADESGRVEAMRQLFDKQDGSIKMKSEVNKAIGEAEYFGGLFVLSEILDSKLLRTYADNVLEVRVSNERKGRIEAVEMNRQVAPEEKKGSFISRMFGRGV